RSGDREAADSGTGRFLCPAAADRRHSLRQDDFRYGVDLDPSARERHRLRVATPVRARHGEGDAVSLGLCEREMSRRTGTNPVNPANPLNLANLANLANLGNLGVLV